MLASAYRAKFPDLDVDTIHGAFLLFKPEQETLELMMELDLIVIDEIGQLSQRTFERLLRLWHAAEKRPALIFVGDFCQLRGVDPTRANDSPMWRIVDPFELKTMRRCKCEELKWKLELLRTAKPSVTQLKSILRNHKAPSQQRRGAYHMTSEPTFDHISAILEETPQTTFLTITRASSAKLNAHPIFTAPADPEANPENYVGSAMHWYTPIALPIYIGAKVTLTKNLNKPGDFVNGMTGDITEVTDSGIIVKTASGKLVSVYPWTDPDTYATFYPMRAGHSTTLHKVQGATLAHATIWLDVPNVEAAGYVALSRVQYDADWRFIGDPTVHHFTPATGF
jgi:ATP-dependent exoDNAse (exonuclease V) alpha subunit